MYFAARGKDSNLEPVRAVAEWVTRMLRMFGLGEGASWDGQIGWGKAPAPGQQSQTGGGEGEGAGAAGGADLEAQVDKYVAALSGFRDEIRKLAIAGASNKDVLALCDRFRDVEMVNLGVQLDDGQGAGTSLISSCTPPSLQYRTCSARRRGFARSLAHSKAPEGAGR